MLFYCKRRLALTFCQISYLQMAQLYEWSFIVNIIVRQNIYLMAAFGK